MVGNGLLVAKGEMPKKWLGTAGVNILVSGVQRIRRRS